MGQRRNLKINLKYFEINENENNLSRFGEAAKAVVRRNLCACVCACTQNVYMKKEQSSKINYPNFNLKKLEI